MDGRQLNMLLKRAWEVESRLDEIEKLMKSCKYPDQEERACPPGHICVGAIGLDGSVRDYIKRMKSDIREVLVNFNKLDK